ncbi:hypothetical protein [Halobellus captivus]|uniref:hypothetical protein n=1 Tax=Halobellus captivus TaxID=2592614 RepID=UPI0011A23CD0|nr:hypothetical protein [Halobellus captivus]
MCYHSQRREALARLGHETGPQEASDDRFDAAESRDSDGERERSEEHHPERPDPETTRRPEPVGFA